MVRLKTKNYSLTSFPLSGISVTVLDFGGQVLDETRIFAPTAVQQHLIEHIAARAFSAFPMHGFTVRWPGGRPIPLGTSLDPLTAQNIILQMYHADEGDSSWQWRIVEEEVTGRSTYMYAVEANIHQQVNGGGEQREQDWDTSTHGSRGDEGRKIFVYHLPGYRSGFTSGNLMQTLLPSDVLAEMATVGVLTDDDVDKIYDEATDEKRTERLLFILARRSSSAFEAFIQSLKEVQRQGTCLYEDIVRLLEGADPDQASLRTCRHVVGRPRLMPSHYPTTAPMPLLGYHSPARLGVLHAQGLEDIVSFLNQASVGDTLKPVTNVPEPVEHFVKTNDATKVEQALGTSNNPSNIVVSGIPKSGKTQITRWIAKQFLHHHPTAVVWALDGQNRQTLLASKRKLLEALNAEVTDEEDVTKVDECLDQALQNRGTPVLLIVDDLEDGTLLTPTLLRERIQSRVLILTRQEELQLPDETPWPCNLQGGFQTFTVMAQHLNKFNEGNIHPVIQAAHDKVRGRRDTPKTDTKETCLEPPNDQDMESLSSDSCSLAASVRNTEEDLELEGAVSGIIFSPPSQEAVDSHSSDNQDTESMSSDNWSLAATAGSIDDTEGLDLEGAIGGILSSSITYSFGFASCSGQYSTPGAQLCKTRCTLSSGTTHNEDFVPDSAFARTRHSGAVHVFSPASEQLIVTEQGHPLQFLWEVAARTGLIREVFEHVLDSSFTFRYYVPRRPPDPDNPPFVPCDARIGTGTTVQAVAATEGTRWAWIITLTPTGAELEFYMDLESNQGGACGNQRMAAHVVPAGSAGLNPEHGPWRNPHMQQSSFPTLVTLSLEAKRERLQRQVGQGSISVRVQRGDGAQNVQEIVNLFLQIPSASACRLKSHCTRKPGRGRKMGVGQIGSYFVCEIGPYIPVHTTNYQVSGRVRMYHSPAHAVADISSTHPDTPSFTGRVQAWKCPDIPIFEQCKECRGPPPLMSLLQSQSHKNKTTKSFSTHLILDHQDFSMSRGKKIPVSHPLKTQMMHTCTFLKKRS
ncbi:hypothetical protein Bbelb_109790 [Branchiostoma belcheri]|nr:hypothetical protein Bbelb_109790 [Branchiostoma belcheri]